MDKKLLSNQKKNIQKIINAYNAYVIQECKSFKKFSGRDIDAFYVSKKIHQKKKFQNTIKRNLINNHLRIYINDINNIGFLSLDIEEISTMSKTFRNIFKKNFETKYVCKNTNLYHLDRKGIIFYKLYKYFFVTIHSYYQLYNLKQQIKKLNKKEFALINKHIGGISSYEISFIKKFLFWDFKKFNRSRKIKDFFYEKIFKRNKKRYVFSGNLNLLNVFSSKKFLYAFFFGSFAKWKKTHNPMPSIAIVGNDGSGKTTVTEYIRKNFSKMDPLIINMKFSSPFFSFIAKILNFIKKINQKLFSNKINFLNFFFAIIGETLILFDKYIKYRIGMAWSDSGMGLTVFERYPTDRIRGEFPNEKFKFLPLEQFFPFPDGIAYLDVLPKDSLKRKKKDNHSLAEMKSKRQNYLSLLKELDNTKIIKSSKSISTKIKKIKNYIFELTSKKKKEIEKNNRTKRIKWKKNFDRKLAGKNLDRSQKKIFYE